MKLIDRYIGSTIIGTTLIVLLMLIGISIFINLVQEVSDIGTGNYGFLAALAHVLFTLPQQVYSFFPMAMLVGVALGLGLLANHNELTVLRASGVSLNRITWAVMKAALLLLIIATLLGEGVGPLAEHSAEYQKTVLTSKGQAMETAGGTWIRDGRNFLYITSILDHNNLQGISRYEFDEHHNLISTSYAAHGFYQNDHWVMQEVVVSKINPNGVTTEHFASSNWQLTINPKLLRISAVDPSEMTLKQLYEYALYLHDNRLNTANYNLALWQRVLQPLATLVMVWLAIPFAFGSMRSWSMGLRIMAGVSMGFAFYLLNQFFGPLTLVYQLPPLLGASLPMLLFALAAYALQRRAR